MSTLGRLREFAMSGWVPAFAAFKTVVEYGSGLSQVFAVGRRLTPSSHLNFVAQKTSENVAPFSAEINIQPSSPGR